MKRILILIVAITSLYGCTKGESFDYPSSVPDDFSIALTWNCYGVSSYDSTTGKLIKTTDATNPDDYITYYQLTKEDKEYIYNLIVSMDIYSYPNIYNPHGDLKSDPPMTLILTVNINGSEKTIKAEDICVEFSTRNKKGQRFLSTCKSIINRLQTTQEWKALPEYEHFYE